MSFFLAQWTVWSRTFIVKWYAPHSIYVWDSQMQKNPLLGGLAFSARVWISLHSDTMLRINCPVSHELLAPPLSPSPHTHTCDTIRLVEVHICTSDVFLIQYTNFQEFIFCISLLHPPKEECSSKITVKIIFIYFLNCWIIVSGNQILF